MIQRLALLTALTALTAILALAGCGGGSDSTPPAPPPPPSPSPPPVSIDRIEPLDTATRKRSASTVEHDEPYKAHNPAEFVAQSAAELKRVVWPTWPQTVSMFSAVLIFVLIMILIVGALDFAFTWGLLKMLGSK